MRAIARLVVLVLSVAAGYVAAVVVYALIARVAQLPESALWDDTLRNAVRTALLILACVGWLWPGMTGGARPVTKITSAVFALMLAAYAVLKLTGFADPDGPDRYAVNAIEPLRRQLGI